MLSFGVRRGVERTQDEELGKQKEKGNLQLRRMNMQLEQAQDYTTKRASFLVAFAEIAEQNIAMSEIEAQMMARLNKAAGGQLDNLMMGAGLSFPGLTPAPETQQPGIADKLQELKNKFVSKDETGDGALPIPPILETPSPEAVKGNGGLSNQDPQ